VEWVEMIMDVAVGC